MYDPGATLGGLGDLPQDLPAIVPNVPLDGKLATRHAKERL
jgi:hypothetical protein